MSKLEIRDFKVQAHLGCTAGERLNSQEVRFSVDIGFDKNPKGEISDELRDSVCYAKVCEEIMSVVQGREFNLVEKLAADCLEQLKNQYPENLISITTHKVRPPIDNLQGGVVYTCGDQFE